MSKLRYPVGATDARLVAAPAVPALGPFATEANAGTPATTVRPPRGGARGDGPRNALDADGLDARAGVRGCTRGRGREAGAVSGGEVVVGCRGRADGDVRVGGGAEPAGRGAKRGLADEPLEARTLGVVVRGAGGVRVGVRRGAVDGRRREGRRAAGARQKRIRDSGCRAVYCPGPGTRDGSSGVRRDAPDASAPKPFAPTLVEVSAMSPARW